jgi:hypothetical protein
VSDVFLVKSLFSALGQGIFKVSGSHTWGATRRFMQKRGWYDGVEEAEGHHWLMEQNQGWGESLPDWIKNQPPFIKILEGSIHDEIPSMGRWERLTTEVPKWAKATFLSTAGHGVQASRPPEGCECEHR